MPKQQPDPALEQTWRDRIARWRVSTLAVRTFGQVDHPARARLFSRVRISYTVGPYCDKFDRHLWRCSRFRSTTDWHRVPIDVHHATASIRVRFLRNPTLERRFDPICHQFSYDAAALTSLCFLIQLMRAFPRVFHQSSVDR